MDVLKGAAGLFDAIPYAPVALFVRLVAAHPFFVSGQTKIDGPTVGGKPFGWDLTMQIPLALRDSTVALFEDEYRVPLLPPDFAAHLTAGLEFVLPVLLVLGLATRVSALALLGMTLVIQFFIYPDAWWSVHAYWTALLCVIVSKGPGALSIDHSISRRRLGGARESMISTHATPT
jgi:putative oxidoreductase